MNMFSGHHSGYCGGITSSHSFSGSETHINVHVMDQESEHVFDLAGANGIGQFNIEVAKELNLPCVYC
jgi:hypothetical protein